MGDGIAARYGTLDIRDRARVAANRFDIRQVVHPGRRDIRPTNREALLHQEAAGGLSGISGGTGY